MPWAAGRDGADAQARAVSRSGDRAGTPADVCPLCGRANGCAMAAGGGAPCWCADVDVAPSALARAAQVAGPAHCLCARCAVALANGRESPQPSPGSR
ncbi:MAG: cysteine-rich CWC family protein [Caldimonas sp.]